MDTTRLLDQLLGGARGYAQRAGDAVADRAGVETDERDSFGKGAAGGALAAGALALLLGTRGGRRLGGAALRLGAVAGIGKLAYEAWKKYAGDDAPQEQGMAIDRLEGEAAEIRSRAVLAALIAASKADGHIDDAEREVIATRLKGLDGMDMEVVEAMLRTPVDAQAIAALADSPQAGREMYAASVFMSDTDAPDERRYLDDLAQALSLEPQVMRDIEAEVAGAKAA